MAIRTSHNGGKLQVNLGTLDSYGEYPFADALKAGTTWIAGGGIIANPTHFTEFGYPTVNPEDFGNVWFTVFNIPADADRPGNWIIDWVGDITVNMLIGHTTVSGSKTGVNGRYVFSRSTVLTKLSVTFHITRINTAVPFTSLRMYHEEDEAVVLAGGYFRTGFVQKLIDLDVGIIRMAGYEPMNECDGVSKWLHRKPVGYISWNSSNYVPNLYCGETTNVGDDYSVDLPAGVSSLEHQDVFLVMFNADASSGTCTLNIGGNGAFPLKRGDGNNFFSNEWPKAGRCASVFWDADLELFCKVGGDSARNQQQIKQLVPPEVMLQLCAEVGAHIWVPCPRFASSPLTDWMPQFATLHKSFTETNNCTWMQFIGEGPNESWNYGGSYPQTAYLDKKAVAYYAPTDTHTESYGRCVSEMGQSFASIYGAGQKGVRYRVAAGMQTLNIGDANQIEKLTSPKYVAAGGSAAHTHITDLAVVTYYGPTWSLNEILAAAHDYNAADAAGKAAILDEILTDFDVDGSVGREKFGIPYSEFVWQTWKAVAVTYGLRMIAYEGGMSFVELQNPGANDYTTTIAGITKAAEAEVTVNDLFGIGTYCQTVGQDVTFNNLVGGMTEIRNLTGTVTEITADNKFKIDIDTSAFTTFTSGGSVTYANVMGYIRDMAMAIRARPLARTQSRRVMQKFVSAGGRFPSFLQVSGPDSQWGNYDPDIYHQLEVGKALEDWHTPTPMRFTLRRGS